MNTKEGGQAESSRNVDRRETTRAVVDYDLTAEVGGEAFGAALAKCC